MDDFENDWAKASHWRASRRWFDLYNNNVIDETRDVMVVFYEEMKVRIETPDYLYLSLFQLPIPIYLLSFDLCLAFITSQKLTVTLHL